MSKFKEKAFWIAAGDFGGRGLAFITTIYLARTLGAEFYGLITVAVSILGYATWGADMGLVNIGVREMAKEPQFRTFRAKEIFTTKVLLGALVLISSTIILSLVSIGSLQKQVILGYLYALVPYALLLEWYYSGRQEFGKIALSKIVNGLVYFGLIFWLIKSSDDVTLVPMLYTIGITSAVVILGTFSLTHHPFTLPSRGFKTYIELLKNGSLIGLGEFFVKIVQLLPPILIGIFFSLREAGIYGAAFKIILVAMLLDRIFVNLLLPNLSSLWTTNKEAAIQRVNMVLRLVIVGGALVSVLTAINADKIVILLFGSEFIESAELLQILSIFIFLTFVNSLFSFGLIATNNDKKYFLATSIGGSLSAIIIILISSYGSPNLVAISVIISEFILATSSFIWFKKVIPTQILRPLLITIVLSVGLFWIFDHFEVHYLLASVISIISIPILVWKTKVIRIGELNWLKEKLLK
ncbi:oligosaccharide flippase family protein [bacterium]|nr:oligosaccharide flippase family protein [Balneola sp.]MBR9916466.1 oligosaccharide flippase family protein [bacterium]